MRDWKPKPTRRQAVLQEGGDVMLDVMPGDDAWAWLAGAVEDFDLLFGQESGGAVAWAAAVFFCQAVVGQHLGDESGADREAPLG